MYTQRPDTNFDELIKSIYGDLEQLEEFEEKEIEKLNKKNINNAYSESCKRGMLYQTEQRVGDFLVLWCKKYTLLNVLSSMLDFFSSLIAQKKRAAIPGALGETVNLPARGIVGLTESPLIEIILRRHPQETAVDRLRKEYIRTSKEMTVEKLKIFLGRKLSYSPYIHFQVRGI
jgi:hypothetical protein